MLDHIKPSCGLTGVSPSQAIPVTLPKVCHVRPEDAHQSACKTIAVPKSPVILKGFMSTMQSIFVGLPLLSLCCHIIDAISMRRLFTPWFFSYVHIKYIFSKTKSPTFLIDCNSRIACELCDQRPGVLVRKMSFIKLESAIKLH